MILESKGLDGKERRTVQGAGVLRQEVGCDLYADRLLLPSGRQFESRAVWPVDSVVVPTAPGFLPAREIASIKEN
jgi:hypothetical protein